MHFLWDQMRELIEVNQLAREDNVFAYDLAWEPFFGAYDERSQWDGEWLAWVEDRSRDTRENADFSVERLRGQGIGRLVLVTHDLALAMQRFDLVLLLNHRMLAFGPPQAVFTQDHIREAFGGQALLLGPMVVVDECCPPGEALVSR